VKSPKEGALDYCLMSIAAAPVTAEFNRNGTIFINMDLPISPASAPDDCVQGPDRAKLAHWFDLRITQ